MVEYCPCCGVRGRKVSSLTLRSLLCDRAQRRATEAAGFFFCKTAACEVVYFKNLTGCRFFKDDLTVDVFEKSAEPSRLVCYCFGYTAENIRDDVVGSAQATVADDIVRKCRAGLDSCEEKNPQGHCCLGNVRALADATSSL